MVFNKQINYQTGNNDDIQPILKAATNCLLLNSSFIDNPGLMHVIPGIAWIYMQLHRLGGGSHFKNEMEYWIDKLSLHKDKDSFLTPYFAEGENIFGVLEGLAGIMLLTKPIKKTLKQ
jgi:hypothetical protein